MVGGCVEQKIEYVALGVASCVQTEDGHEDVDVDRLGLIGGSLSIRTNAGPAEPSSRFRGRHR